MNSETRKRLAHAALKTFDLSVFGKINIEAASSTLEHELQKRLQLNDPKTTYQRHDFFKIPNSKQKDYEERLFQVAMNKNVLAGIRHFGGNVEKPFISLWPDYEFETLVDLKEVYSVIADEFAVFGPKHLSLWVNSKQKLGLQLSSVLTPSLRYVVGSVKEIKNKPLPPNSEKVSLVTIEDNSYRGWYEELYKEFHRKFAELKRRVPVNDQEDMDSCLNDRLLFFIYIDGQKAGLIGGRKEELLGQSGVYFTEIVLSSEFKSRGFAAAAQRAFTESLPESTDLVWGTIDAKNVSSTKTALRVGRIAIRSEFFVPVAML